MSDNKPVQSKFPTETPAAPSSLRAQLSKFVEWVNPYKEVAVLFVAAFAAISASVAWAVSYFATQAALAELECQIIHDKGTKGLADASAATASAVALLHAQTRVLVALPPTPDTIALMKQLMTEANQLTAANAKEIDTSAQKLHAAFATCKRAAGKSGGP